MRGVRSLAAELNLEQMRRGRTTEHVIEQLASAISRVYMVPGIPESAVIDHGEILDAIASHDDEKARAAIRKHMESSRRALGATNLIRPRVKSRMSRITGEK